MIGLLGNPYALVALAIGLAISHAAAYFQGRSDGKDGEIVKCQADKIAAKAEQEADRKKQQGAADSSGRAESATQEKVRIVYRTIKEQVNHEVAQNPPPSDCRLSDGLYDAWNAANAGEGASPPSVPATSGEASKAR